jgi:hypothetical protein
MIKYYLILKLPVNIERFSDFSIHPAAYLQYLCIFCNAVEPVC